MSDVWIWCAPFSFFFAAFFFPLRVFFFLHAYIYFEAMRAFFFIPLRALKFSLRLMRKFAVRTLQLFLGGGLTKRVLLASPATGIERPDVLGELQKFWRA